MSKNIKSNNDEIPAKNGGDDQSNNIGLDINEVVLRSTIAKVLIILINHPIKQSLMTQAINTMIKLHMEIKIVTRKQGNL
jgi:hypothetical protein